MKRRASALAVTVACAVAAGTSCGPVAGPPPPPVPLNSCPAHPCAAFVGSQPPTCGGGICVSSDSRFDFTLVVSLPESSYYAPGMTVPIASFASATQSSSCGASSTSASVGLSEATCLRIPQVVEPSGELLVENQVIVAAQANGTYIDTNGDPDGGAVFTQWSLPVHVRYWPLWPPPSTDVTSPSVSTAAAASLGMPLVPADATILAASFPGVGAPRGTTATQWRAPLSPGTYERDIVPDNAAFPVITDTIQAGNDEYSTPIPSVAPAQATVIGANGSLAGFSVYLRDATTHRRVSSTVTLGPDSSQSVTLLTRSPVVAGSQLEFVVAPPDGSPIPYIADPILTGVPSTGLKESFPPLPSPVIVSGTVVTPDVAQTPVQASLVIDSAATSASVGGIYTAPSDPSDAFEPFLHYSTTVLTDSHGHYAVTLPPGTYDIFVTPVAGANAGAASVPLAVAIPLAGEPPVAAGKTLVAAPLGTLTGIATIADGRPLAGAVVQAQASVSLAAAVPPVDPRRWPRAQTTTTDVNGAFSMQVDPGTYDVVVQPAQGSGFPWITLSSQVVSGAKTLTLPPMIVPAPQSIDLVLHDPGDNPLVRTIVRAFAPAPASGTETSTPGAPPPVIEIGSWITDTSGHLTMLLAPPH